MHDRVSLYPGRVTLTPVAGQTNTYDMTRADQPTQEGTPLNKASLLKDETAQKYGFGAEALPDDIFDRLAFRDLQHFRYVEFLSSITWKAPNNIVGNKIHVLCCGGGGGGFSGGGGGGHISQADVVITPGSTYPIVIGAGGAGGGGSSGNASGLNGGTTSAFGVSANGGNGASGNDGGDGGSGGGGGGGNPNSNGGNGSYGGGGGGGPMNNKTPITGGKGGNGGKYGGGGGGGSGYLNSTGHGNPGNGGTYGGNGGYGGNGNGPAYPTDASDGTIAEFPVIFPFVLNTGGLAGIKNTATNYVGGGGGGGYGGNGGNYGGGGGGYGGNGGSADSQYGGGAGTRGGGGGGAYQTDYGGGPGGSGVVAIWYYVTEEESE